MCLFLEDPSIEYISYSIEQYRVINNVLHPTTTAQ